MDTPRFTKDLESVDEGDFVPIEDKSQEEVNLGETFLKDTEAVKASLRRGVSEITDSATMSGVSDLDVLHTVYSKLQRLKDADDKSE